MKNISGQKILPIYDDTCLIKNELGFVFNIHPDPTFHNVRSTHNQIIFAYFCGA